MSRKSVQIPIRFEPEDVERAEAILAALAESEQYRALRLTRAAVLRWAVIEGFAVLEERHQVRRPTASSKKTPKR